VLDLIGWTQAIGGTLDLVRGRLPLGHPNSVAAVILLLMPPAVVFGLGCDKGFWRLFHLACAALMFLGVLFALSRSAMLCLVMILAPTMLYLIWRARGWRRLVLGGLSFVFCAALVAIALYLFSQYDFSRYWSRGYHEDASVTRRTDSLYTALAIWGDYPVFGISPDAFYMRFDIRKDWDMPSRDEISGLLFYKSRVSAETPHNLLLMALSEFGLLGGSLFLLLLFFLLRLVWRARKQPFISDYDRLALSGLLFGFCGFLLMQIFGAELLAALRASIVFWVMAAFTAHYAGLVEDEAKRFAENTTISHTNPSDRFDTTEAMGMP
ncbi:MAG TPA: O-antigen ligase domain-containing protein, partial [Candidatus Hydrogenedentes bacterium]|nr:O-antigen ligase domain-containing protein [Candidatus Hydrogenedentota bacterium]